MPNIISCIFHFCRSCASVNVTSISKKSAWPFSPLFLDTSNSKYFVLVSKLCTDKSNSSEKDNSPSSVDKNDSNSKNTDGDDSNKDTPVGSPQDTFFTKDPAFGNKDNKGLAAGSRPFFNPEHTEENVISEYDLEPPTNCCMSGCPNCVWLEYVEKLTTRYANPELSREKILKELDAMEDQNIKAFIMMELRTRKLI